MRRRKPPRPTKIQLRYSDDAILVVEKPGGLLTVRTPSGKDPDLISILREQLGRKDELAYVYAAHRLDRTASGLLVLARSRKILDAMIEQFKARKVERRYLAGVRGQLADSKGTFDSWVRERKGDHTMVPCKAGTGRHAISHYALREYKEAIDVSLVEVTLETGIKNQIRFHFAHAGQPLLGERKYLPPKHADYDSMQGKRRIFLHAERLVFFHPVNNKRLTYSSVLPPDLNRWIRQMEKDAGVPSRRGSPARR